MTNTNMEIFNSEEFGSVRIIEEDGKYLFCASDVAKALGYSNIYDAVRRHCRGLVKREAPTTSGIQTMSYIPEGDVYRLIVHSKLPSAEHFERWVFDEVLPSLRKNGIYITDPLVKKVIKNPNFLYALVDTLKQQDNLVDTQTEMIKAQQEKIAEKDEHIERQENLILDMSHVVFMQEVEIEEKDEIIEDMSWKAAYYDNHVDTSDGVPIRVLAKQLEISEKYLVSILMGCRFLYRCGGHLLPYADKRCAGLFKVRESETLVTPKGKDKIFKVVEAMRFDAEAAV